MSRSLRSVIKLRAPHFCALAACLCVTGLVIGSGLAESGDQVLFDALMFLRVRYGSGEMNRQIRPVDLTDRTEQVLGEAIVTRQIYADALIELNRVKAMPVLDFFFQEPRAGDNEFIRAAEDSGFFILPLLAVDKNISNSLNRELRDADRELLKKHLWHFTVSGKDTIPEADGFFMPLTGLAQAARYIAHLNVNADADGRFRRIPIFYKWKDQDSGEYGYLPSLALAAALLKLDVDPAALHLIPGRALIIPYKNLSIRIPVDRAGVMLIPYTVPYLKAAADDKSRYNLDYIVRAKEDGKIADTVFEAFTGKIAFIADLASMGKDYGTTVFEKDFPRSGIHIAVLGSILNLDSSSFIAAPPWPFRIVSLIILFVVICFILPQKRDLVFNIGFAALFALYSFCIIFCWSVFKFTPWFTAPTVLLFFAWLWALVYRFGIRYRERLLLKSALSRYVSDELSDRILREGRTDLKPVRKELTILFSDIKGFTQWSSDKEPEVVHDFLDEYLEAMSDIIRNNGGTIDKFMGDGMLAFFGDPFDLPRHTEHCVRAAVSIQMEVRRLAEKWRRTINIDLQIRIGINTGEVIVGNLGSNKRIEYTVIGSAVNLAQRMENAAAPGKILMTKTAWGKVSHLYQAVMDMKDIKGYPDKLETWELDP